ncbi:Protein lin-37 [Trichinella spiralis]|uniref:Protein lin-37 n=1 Tax=Trichinella spiralis TaxID=6334 RepID=A0ABR3KL54_TRISP
MRQHLVFSSVSWTRDSQHELLEVLRRVFDRLHHAGIHLNREKCVFNQYITVEIYFCIKLFLTEEKRCPVKLKDWLVDKKPNKSHPSEALHRLLDKARYDDQLPVILTCDHPPHGVVCVLAHELVCGREATIAFHSRTLAASERKYAHIERELRHRCCHCCKGKESHCPAGSIEMNVFDLEPFEPPPNLTSPEVVKAYKDFDIAIHRMKEDMHRAIKSQMADASGNDGRNEARECSGRKTADSTPVKSRKRAKDKEKKIIFELCQKSFELRQVHGNYSLYRLSRIWMYGNDEPRHMNKAENETTEEEPIDGIAQTRAAELEKSDASLVKWNERNTEIYSLPPPSPSTSPISRIPPTVSYLPHWKEVKKTWLRQSRLADRPYQKSLDMLKLMYNNAQEKNT